MSEDRSIVPTDAERLAMLDARVTELERRMRDVPHFELVERQKLDWAVIRELIQ